MREQSEEKRKRILRAAEELLFSRSPHEVKLDEIAERAGIGKGTIYLHFKDKNELFFEVAMFGLTELCELIRQVAAKRDRDFQDQLLEVCRELSGFFEQRRALVREMQSGQHHWANWPDGFVRTRWLARRKELLAAVGGVIQAGQEQGEIRDDVPAEVLGDYLLGMLRTRARDLEGASESWRSEEFLVRFFREGAGKREVLPAGRN